MLGAGERDQLFGIVDEVVDPLDEHALALALALAAAVP
jgi:hypothetical protein